MTQIPRNGQVSNMSNTYTIFNVQSIVNMYIVYAICKRAVAGPRLILMYFVEFCLYDRNMMRISQPKTMAYRMIMDNNNNDKTMLYAIVIANVLKWKAHCLNEQRLETLIVFIHVF